MSTKESKRNWKCKLGFHEDGYFTQEDGDGHFIACLRCGMCIKSEHWSKLENTQIRFKSFNDFMKILELNAY